MQIKTNIKWYQPNIEELPLENELLIVDVSESTQYRETARFEKTTETDSQIIGTFNFSNGTGVHLYKNNTCVVRRFCYVKDI